MKWRRKHSKRTITIIGDEGEFRYFFFDDCAGGILAQTPIEDWNSTFEIYE